MFGTQLDSDRALLCGGLNTDTRTGFQILANYNQCYIYSISTGQWTATSARYDETARTFPFGVDLPLTNEWYITGGSRSSYGNVISSTQILNKDVRQRDQQNSHLMINYVIFRP